MKSRTRKIDTVWDNLFEHFNILNHINQHGIYEISAEEINTIGQYQARLATKYDNKGQLPMVFQENNLSLLPISRGNYMIGHFDVFAELKFDNFDTPIKKRFPNYIESIDADDITSESIALNAAHASGMIDDFLGENETNLTLSGRMGSGLLEFQIKNRQTKHLDQIQVMNAQVEIDGGYEGAGSLALIEAKNNIPMDFMVRQLYYPFLLVKNKIPYKNIRPVFFTYSKNVFSFHEFEFENSAIYSSIKKVRQQNYILDIFDDITLQDILDIYHSTKAWPEPDANIVTFPQADYFGRMMNLLDFLNVNKGKTKEEITEKYSFNERQADYYWNALVYLGLGEKQRPGQNRKLNSEGKKLADYYSLKEQKLTYVWYILQRGAFREYFEMVLRNDYEPIDNDIAKALVIKHAQNIDGSTLGRRATTLRSWVHWIFSIITDK